MRKKVQLKTKKELLEMGYENNNDPQDFLNLMSGKIVTLDLDKTRRASCGGIIYFSIEYPENMIYDYLIKRVITEEKPVKKENIEYTYNEIGKRYGFKMQRSEQIVKQALRKLRKIVENYKEGDLNLNSPTSLFP